MAILIDLLAAGVVDSSGAVLANGVAYVYQVGTTTPANIYQDVDLTIPASNPVTLDAVGRAEVYTGDEVRLVVKTSSGTTVIDIDSLGDIPAETVTTNVDALTRNYIRAVSRKPNYDNDGVDSSTFRIPASATSPACVIIDGTLYVNTSSVTVDLDTSGRNGLDTGAKAANTPYYVYAVPALNGENFDAVISVTAPSTGPTGWTSWSYIGAICTKSTAASLQPFTASNGFLLHYVEVETETHNSATRTVKTFASMPTTVKKAYFQMPVTGTDLTSAMSVSPNDAGNDNLSQVCQVSNKYIFSWGWVNIFTAQTVYLTAAAGNTLELELYGWQEDPLEWP